MSDPVLQFQGSNGKPTAVSTSNPLPSTVTNATALGQTTMGNSVPVTLASDQTPVPVKPSFTELAGLSAGSLNADLIPATDISSYEWILLHLNGGAYVGTLTFQYSNDLVDWRALNAYSLLTDNAGSGGTITTSTTAMYMLFKKGRYLRVRMTGYSSGAATGVAEFYTSPPMWAFSIIQAAQQGSWTISGTSIIAGPTANATQAANTNADTVIKASSGYLWSATVTTTGTAALSIYDNATTHSGTILLSIPANAVVGTIYSFPGGSFAANGITSGGVANCPAVTFQYA